MAIDPNLVSTIQVPQLDTEGLTDNTLFPHQVVGQKLKKATLLVLVAYLQGKLTFSTKAVIDKTNFDILTDGDGLFYMEFKDATGTAFAAGVRPYCVESKTSAITTPIPPLLYNNDAWSFPRIYNMPDPATTQAIKLYVI